MCEDARYKELIVWQKAMELVDWVYKAMRAFPKDERFRLCDLSDAEALSGEIRRMLNSLIAKLTRPTPVKDSI